MKIITHYRKDLENDFKEIIRNRIEEICDLEYAFRKLTICWQALVNLRAGQNPGVSDKQFFLICYVVVMAKIELLKKSGGIDEN